MGNFPPDKKELDGTEESASQASPPQSSGTPAHLSPVIATNPSDKPSLYITPSHCLILPPSEEAQGLP